MWGKKIPDGSIFLNNRKLFQSEILFIEQTLKKKKQTLSFYSATQCPAEKATVMNS